MESLTSNSNLTRKAALANTIQGIEDAMCKFYGMVPTMPAKDFLLTKSETQKHFQNQLKLSDGSVLIRHNAKQELEIGIYFNQNIIETIHQSNPIEAICHHNLEALFVLIEEVSHFHLIVNRATSDRVTSELELEWQGEIDKVVVTNTLLLEQTRKDHLVPLYQLLFEKSSLYIEREVYREANRYAAKFWQYFLKADRHPSFFASTQFRRFMRTNYNSQLEDKFPFQGRYNQR